MGSLSYIIQITIKYMDNIDLNDAYMIVIWIL